jgi:hypothetical protein
MTSADKKAIEEIVNQMRENVNNRLHLTPKQTIEVLKVVELQKLNNNLEKLISKTSKT